MKKAVLILALSVFLSIGIYPQDLQKKAEDNPLDCALYLLKDDSRRIDAFTLASAFFETGHYDKVITTLEFEQYSQLDYLVFFTAKLTEKNKTAEAKKFLDRISFLLANNESAWEEDALINLAPILIKFGKPDEAVQLIKLVEYEDEKVKAAVGIAKALGAANYPDKALKTLEGFYEIANPERKAEIIEIYARLKQKEKAEKLLAEFEPVAFIDERFYHNRRFILFPLINANLALGKTDHALELWQQHGEVDDDYGFIKLIDALSEFGYQDRSIFYLNQIAREKDLAANSASEITERFLKLNDVNRATEFAKAISDDIENYEQHKALNMIADQLIKDGKFEPALEILDFSLQRAKKIVFQHEPMQSASSGINKRNFLFQIYARFIKLKKFQKAYETIYAINSDHSIAGEFIAESLIDLAKHQIKTLPRKKIYKSLAQAQNIVKDEEYYSIKAKLLSAEVYAQIGENDKAVKLIAKALEEAKESCCYEEIFLISAGKVLETNKLKADANIKKILREYIAVAGN